MFPPALHTPQTPLFDCFYTLNACHHIIINSYFVSCSKEQHQQQKQGLAAADNTENPGDCQLHSVRTMLSTVCMRCRGSVNRADTLSKRLLTSRVTSNSSIT